MVWSRLWTGETGRAIRKAGRDAQVVAVYLLSCPSSNDIGLYYLPFPTLLHEVGMSRGDALAALHVLSDLRFAHYHAPTEIVFLPEMAKFQLGPALKAKDNRVSAVRRQAETYRKSEFFDVFWDRYEDPYHLGPRPPEPVVADSLLFSVGDPPNGNSSPPKPIPKKSSIIKQTDNDILVEELSDVPDVLAIAQLWVADKIERKQSYKQTGLKTLCRQMKKVADEHGVQHLRDSVETAMTNTWKGWLKPPRRPTPNDSRNNTNREKGSWT